MSDKQGPISGSTFLVCDRSLESWGADFYKWLKSEGFELWESSKGLFRGVIWVYININSRLFAPGIPGIPITLPIVGDHAITIDEFKAIYAILKKYEGKDIFVFHEERFDYDRPSSLLPKENTEELSFEGKIRNRARTIIQVENKNSSQELKEFSDKGAESQEIALAHANELLNLSYEQELGETRQAINELKEISDAWAGNKEIALRYAQGLINLSNKQKLAEARKTLDKLKDLRNKWPQNEEIALIYTEGLDNLNTREML